MNTEAKELSTVEPAKLQTVPSVQSDTLTILASAIERGADAEQLERLMALHERNQANEARKAYFEAFAAFAVNPPIVTKDKINPQYESAYSSLENTVNTISAHLGKFGLSHHWQVDQSAGIAVTCILSHVAGHSEQVTLAGPPDTSGKKNALQQIKSTLTYLKLATFEAVTGAASEIGSLNDDGTAGGTPLLTDKQIVEINDYLKDEKLAIDVPAFLKYMGVEFIDHIPAAKWPAAMNAIDRKRKKMEEEK